IPAGERLGCMSAPRLSICIATRNRAHVIGQALENMGRQLGADAELVVVDGASTDNTREVVEGMRSRFPQIRYLPQAPHSGIDGDFDRAIALARGEYCWPMSDDDLLAEGAVARVLGLLAARPDALIVDAEVCTDDLSQTLIGRRLPFEGVRKYTPSE